MLVHVLQRMLLMELLVLMPMERTPVMVAVEAAIWARDPRSWYDWGLCLLRSLRPKQILVRLLSH